MSSSETIYIITHCKYYKSTEAYFNDITSNAICHHQINQLDIKCQLVQCVDLVLFDIESNPHTIKSITNYFPI